MSNVAVRSGRLREVFQMEYQQELFPRWQRQAAPQDRTPAHSAPRPEAERHEPEPERWDGLG